MIVSLMQSENSGALRKLAVKSLSHIVEVDPSLMTKKSIRDAVETRFKDEAISVREAAVNLVGTFVLQEPESAKIFHQPLLFRLNDAGVSVVSKDSSFRTLFFDIC
jgi:cohesin loading factor subunit SCC2